MALVRVREATSSVLQDTCWLLDTSEQPVGFAGGYGQDQGLGGLCNAATVIMRYGAPFATRPGQPLLRSVRAFP